MIYNFLRAMFSQYLQRALISETGVGGMRKFARRPKGGSRKKQVDVGEGHLFIQDYIYSG